MRKELEKAVEIAKAAGFAQIGELDASTIELLDSVREMCNANSCRVFGKSWACPPGCGELEELRSIVSRYHYGILVQTVGELEDSMDFETMQETEARQKECFYRALDDLKKEYPDMLALGAGTCTICKACTYPDAPCRFPERKVSSMEAFGIFVSDLCTKNNVKYYYGPDTIAYTSCYLLV